MLLCLWGVKKRFENHTESTGLAGNVLKVYFPRTIKHALESSAERIAQCSVGFSTVAHFAFSPNEFQMPD